MRFCSRTLPAGLSRRRLATSIFAAALLVQFVASPACAQLLRGRGQKRGGPADAPPVEAAAPKEKVPPMSKTQAIMALINALRANQSDAAREALEQIVLGKMKFGGHDQQAAETALVALVMRPDSPKSILKLLAEPDDKIRPDDKNYPAATVKFDAVRIAGRVGSPELRLGVAKLYDQSSPEIRRAIEMALSRPSPASFSAQVALVRSRTTPDQFKATLRKLILDQNASALKQALKIESAAPAKDPSAALAAQLLGQFGKFGGGGTPGPSLPGTPAGVPHGAQNSNPPVGAPAAAAAAAQNPVGFILDAAEKALDAKPVDAAVVARELWQSEFVEALAAQLASEKANAQSILTGVGSIPLKSAHERMRDYLQGKGPQELGQLEKPKPPTPPGGGSGVAGAGAGAPGYNGGLLGGGGLGRAGRGMPGGAGGGKPGGAATTQEPAYLVGSEWLDPGTVVVLKTLTYKDRPKTRHRTPTSSPPNGRRSAAAEKKAEEAAEKAKQAEASYEWRDTIEKFVSHWDDRLSAVAEKHEAAETDNGATGDKVKADAKAQKDETENKSKTGSKKSGTPSDSASKKTARGSDSKSSSDSKSKGPSSAPTSAVPVPFALRPGEQITKEFHLHWPDDLPSNLSAAVSEPLVVHYLRLEANDDMNRTATYYRSALAKAPGTRALSTTHDVADGKWVDILQRDLTGKRIRSLDILITREPGDPDAKKSKTEDLTIQVLMVEVESFEPEPKGTDKAEKKEQAKSDSP